MDLKPATKKSFSTSFISNFIPRPTEIPVVAYFNGFSCYVKDREMISQLFESGFYGKGNLSKSFPNFNTCHDDFPEFLQKQQWLNRKSQNLYRHDREIPCSQIRKRSLAEKSILDFSENSKRPRVECRRDVLNCSPYLACNLPLWTSENSINENSCERSFFQNMVEEKLKNDNICKNVSSLISSRKDDHLVVVEDVDKARLENNVGVPKEDLRLSLQESFFLGGMVGVLHIFDQLGKRLTADDMWLLFQHAEPEFIKKYVVYHWYRSRGWVVRNGLFYGGDYVLYEKGPTYCHSSYVIRVLDEQSKLTWNDLASLSRLCETVQKDVIYCTVIPPNDLNVDDLKNPLVIRRFKISEVMHRRWIPTHHLNPKENYGQ